MNIVRMRLTACRDELPIRLVAVLCRKPTCVQCSFLESCNIIDRRGITRSPRTALAGLLTYLLRFCLPTPLWRYAVAFCKTLFC